MSTDMLNLKTARDKIVACGVVARTSDSKKESAFALSKRDEMVKWLRLYCPHDLIVIQYCEGFNHDENCRTNGCMQCVRCGLLEYGTGAGVDHICYTWLTGTYKTLLTEPIARFEPASKYEGNILQGRWTKGDPLDYPLEELLQWISQAGYKHASAERCKMEDQKSRDRKEEEKYQYFKTKYLDRLTREIIENYRKGDLE